MHDVRLISSEVSDTNPGFRSGSIQRFSKMAAKLHCCRFITSILDSPKLLELSTAAQRPRHVGDSVTKLPEHVGVPLLAVQQQELGEHRLGSKCNEFDAAARISHRSIHSRTVCKDQGPICHVRSLLGAPGSLVGLYRGSCGVGVDEVGGPFQNVFISTI